MKYSRLATENLLLYRLILVTMSMNVCACCQITGVVHLFSWNITIFYFLPFDDNFCLFICIFSWCWLTIVPFLCFSFLLLGKYCFSVCSWQRCYFISTVDTSATTKKNQLNGKHAASKRPNAKDITFTKGKRKLCEVIKYRSVRKIIIIRKFEQKPPIDFDFYQENNRKNDVFRYDFEMTSDDEMICTEAMKFTHIGFGGSKSFLFFC